MLCAPCAPWLRNPLTTLRLSCLGLNGHGVKERFRILDIQITIIYLVIWQYLVVKTCDVDTYRVTHRRVPAKI
jgi:hypothetical protein